MPDQVTLPELRDSLRKAKQEEAREERDLNDLKGANKALEASIGAIEQISGEYRGKQLALQNARNQHSCFQKDALARIKEKLGDTAPVDEIVAKYDAHVEKFRKELADTIEPAVVKAKADYDAAFVTERAKKDAFDALKNRAKALDAALKALDDLKKAADTYEKDGKLEPAYFVLLEHNAELAKVGAVADPAMFEADFIRALAESEAASADVRKKKNAFDDVVRERDDAKKLLDKAVTDRRKLITEQFLAV